MKFLGKFFLIGTVAALLCSVTPHSVEAQIQKVGIVNFKTCIEESKFGKQEQANFESMKKQMEDVLVEKEKALTEISNKFNDADYLDSLSPEAEEELKHKFRTLNQELSQHQQQCYQMLNQANYKIVQAGTEAITKASKTVAQNKELDVVVNDEGTFYYNTALDISDDVVLVMDQMFEKESEE